MTSVCSERRKWHDTRQPKRLQRVPVGVPSNTRLERGKRAVAIEVNAHRV